MYNKNLENYYEIECLDAEGNLKWNENFSNLVVTAGLNDSIDKHFKGSSYTASWYVGLSGSSPTFAAGDTMSSHAGWVEITAYSEASREALTLGTITSGSADNSASKASFSINGTVSVGGAFITTGSTIGGTVGTIYGGGAFSSGNRSVISGDTVNVTVTVSATAS